jgi:hypothetical protein
VNRPRPIPRPDAPTHQRSQWTDETVRFEFEPAHYLLFPQWPRLNRRFTVATYELGIISSLRFCIRPFLSKLEVSMSSLQQRYAVVTDTITSLNLRIRELERLRDQVKKAERSTRRSRPKSRKRRARV